MYFWRKFFQYPPNAKQRGFGFIEILVVISILLIIASVTTPVMSSFLVQYRYRTTLNGVRAAFSSAQINAMTGKLDETWGVCVSNQRIVVFAGSCGSPVYQKRILIPNQVTVSGLSTITFNTRGEPSSPLTVTVASTRQSAAVTLNTAGGVNVQ